MIFGCQILISPLDKCLWSDYGVTKDGIRSVTCGTLGPCTGCGQNRGTIVGLQQKTGLAEQLMGTFGMSFAVQDESPDTWVAGAHAAEKLMLVRMMQVGDCQNPLHTFPSECCAAL